METQKHKASKPVVKRQRRFTARLSCRLEPDLEARFKRAAIRSSQTFDGAMRIAIAQFCESVEQKPT